MLILLNNGWQYKGSVNVVQTHDIIKRNLGSGEYSDSVYGSYVDSKGVVTSIKVNNPKEPNVKMSFLDIVKLHKEQIELGAFNTTNLGGDSSSDHLTEILRDMGEYTHTPHGAVRQLVFLDGNWEYKCGTDTFTVFRTRTQQGFYTTLVCTRAVLRPGDYEDWIKTEEKTEKTIFSKVAVPVNEDYINALLAH